MAVGRRLSVSRRARQVHPGRCPTNAGRTRATAVTAPAACGGRSGDGWTWLRDPEVQPVFQLDGLRLIGAGLLLQKEPFPLVRIFGGELGVLRTQSKE